MKKRITRSIIQALSKTGIYLGLFSAVVTIIGIVGYESIVESPFMRFIGAMAILLLAFFIALAKCFFRNKVEVQLGNGRIAYIEYGCVFEKTGIIIIPFNRYFDTLVNEKVVNKNSMVGGFVKYIYPGNLKELDATLSASIGHITHETVEKEGKKDSYPIGTIAKIGKGANEYYCLALTDVDIVTNKSICNIEMLNKSLLELLNFINENSNGVDVYMPLLGSGFSRLNRDKQVILELIIATLKASDIPLQSKLHIVLLEAERDLFDLTKRY